MKNGQGSGRSALILYATETGTSQDLAGEIDQVLERLRFNTDCSELDQFTFQQLHNYDLVVFVIPTTGQGDFPTNGRKFWTSLLRKKLTSTTLEGICYALVGLGDSSYFKFNWAARKFEKRIKQLGAQQLLDSCEADEQGDEGTEGFFLPWLSEFKQKIISQIPLASGESVIPDDIPLARKWLLRELNESSDFDDGDHENDNNNQISSSAEDFHVTLIQNDRVTPSTHWQDVRFLRLESSEVVEYEPGDAIAILPKNMPRDVERLIEMMNWNDIADRKLTFSGSVPLNRIPLPMSTDSNQCKSFTLRYLLAEQLDINSIPRRSFFASIAKYTSDEMHKERLLEFTEPQYLDEYFDYATRPRRSILEVLQEFDTIKIPWREVISIFPPLRARQFSIASGGSLKSSKTGSRFDLLVAIVKYKTVIKRIREGVCTRYLAQLPVGTTLKVTLRNDGRFISRKSPPVENHILIGAGTGIAPLRALIYEKSLQPASKTTLLIFGARSTNADFYFRDEWTKLSTFSSESNGNLELITAFSRDQKEKLYVQDRIREHGSIISKLLLDNNATVIICGSAGQMPKAVKQAIKDALIQYTTKIDQKNTADGSDVIALKNDDEAEDFITQLEKRGRFKQETWS